MPTSNHVRFPLGL